MLGNLGHCDSVEHGRQIARENGHETVMICTMYNSLDPKQMKWVSPAFTPHPEGGMGKIFYSGPA